jgi:hypothetical protein
MVEAHQGVLVERCESINHHTVLLFIAWYFAAMMTPCTPRSDVPTIEFIIWTDERLPPQCEPFTCYILLFIDFMTSLNGRASPGVQIQGNPDELPDLVQDQLDITVCHARLSVAPSRHAASSDTLSLDPSCRQKFVLQVLGETVLFIKRGREQWLLGEVDKWQRSNSYESTDFKA